MSRATEQYQIHTRLAVGDAGFVYRATDLATGRTVALKLLLSDTLIEHPLDVESLLRDAPGISRLTGVNIVQLLDAFADEDGTVLVYEFAEGTRGLDVPGTCPIPAEQAVDVAAQLLGALRSGERQSYPHGDLKPSDISLVRLPDGRPLVMVLDWGLANYRPEPTPGALPYTPPERLAGAPPSHVSDLFSAGAVLTYLFTGRQLVAGTTKEDFAAAWQSLDVSALGTLRPDLPAELVKWIARLLQADPARRPASAVEALTALAEMNPPFPPAVPESIRPRPVRPNPQPQPARSVATEVSATPVVSPEVARVEIARIRKKSQSLSVLTTYGIMLVTLVGGGFAFWKMSQSEKKNTVASKPAQSAQPTPQPSPATTAPPAPVVAAASAPAAVQPKQSTPVATGARGAFSTSTETPTVDATDIANFAAQTGTDKWFFGGGAERYGADAAKGLTFTTGAEPVLFKALTFKLAPTANKSATPDQPTTWTIRLGTLSGNNFTQVTSEQMEQTADTTKGAFITWTLSKPVPLAAETTYAVDVAMLSRTTWQTGIPYLACSGNVATKGVGVSYSSGGRGAGGPTISSAGKIDRVFHLDLEAQ